MRISDWSSDVCSSDLCPLYALVHLAPAQPFKQTHAKSDVVIDTHGKRCGLLKDHTDLGAHQGNIQFAFQQVLAIEFDHALGALARIQLEHPVDRKSTRLNSSH